MNLKILCGSTVVVVNNRWKDKKVIDTDSSEFLIFIEETLAKFSSPLGKILFLILIECNSDPNISKHAASYVSTMPRESLVERMKEIYFSFDFTDKGIPDRLIEAVKSLINIESNPSLKILCDWLMDSKYQSKEFNDSVYQIKRML